MEKLIIRKTDIADREKLVSFNERIYPSKKRIKECQDFWASQTPDAVNNNIVLVDEEGNIHGQMFTTGMNYYYNGNNVQSVWLYDLIVEEQLRKSAWGVDMIVYAMSLYPNSCSTGSGPQALPLHLKLGNKMLGEIRKYVKIVNPFYFFSALNKGELKKKDFPSVVLVNGHSFFKVKFDQFPELKGSYNENLFEIGRSKEFVQWRFYNNFHDYAVYKDECSKNYFVVRTIVKKGVTSLVLVDYRFCIDKIEEFSGILSATGAIAKQLHIPVIICGSSHSACDSVLEAKRFKSVGRPRPIIGFVKCKDRKVDIESRKFCFVTLADSDGETNW